MVEPDSDDILNQQSPQNARASARFKAIIEKKLASEAADDQRIGEFLKAVSEEEDKHAQKASERFLKDLRSGKFKTDNLADPTEPLEP